MTTGRIARVASRRHCSARRGGGARRGSIPSPPAPWARDRPRSGRSISESRTASSTLSASRSIRSFAPSSTAIAQQVAAGSTNLTVGSGIVDPIRAIEKGAPIAIWRVDMQAPPYALLAKPAIKSIKELKGKTISIGGAKDITRIFVERMLVPNGVNPANVDYVFAGATSARLSALQSGAVDAAILTSPHQFLCRGRGLHQSRLDHRIRQGTAVLRRRGEPRLGRGQQAGARQIHCRLQQERELVPGSQQSRCRREDHDGGRTAETGRCREELRLSAEREISTS